MVRLAAALTVLAAPALAHGDHAGTAHGLLHALPGWGQVLPVLAAAGIAGFALARWWRGPR